MPRPTSSNLKGTLQNLGLSAATVVLFLGSAETVCRLLERAAPPRPTAHYIANWQEWDGDFYTVSTTAIGQPPWNDYNSAGLRDREHDPRKPAGTRRVVCLGDSTTLGFGLRPAEAYPQVLESLLQASGRAVEVFNVALWGWSTRQERIAYRRIARRYSPDHVLLAVCLNDIPELQDNLARPPPLHRRAPRALGPGPEAGAGARPRDPRRRGAVRTGGLGEGPRRVLPVLLRGEGLAQRRARRRDLLLRARLSLSLPDAARRTPARRPEDDPRLLSCRGHRLPGSPARAAPGGRGGIQRLRPLQRRGLEHGGPVRARLGSAARSPGSRLLPRSRDSALARGPPSFPRRRGARGPGGRGPGHRRERRRGSRGRAHSPAR